MIRFFSQTAKNWSFLNVSRVQATVVVGTQKSWFVTLILLLTSQRIGLLKKPIQLQNHFDLLGIYLKSLRLLDDIHLDEVLLSIQQIQVFTRSRKNIKSLLIFKIIKWKKNLVKNVSNPTSNQWEKCDLQIWGNEQRYLSWSNYS